MVMALVFLASVIIAMVLVLRSEMPRYWRVCIMLAIAIFALLGYLLAAKSEISPFSVVDDVSFGFWDRSVSAIIAAIGAVAGIIGSYFFHLGRRAIHWRDFVRPLTTCPIVLIPTIKLVEASGEQTLLTLMMLFALSYQNGFFWERLLKPGDE